MTCPLEMMVLIRWTLTVLYAHDVGARVDCIVYAMFVVIVVSYSSDTLERAKEIKLTIFNY